MAYNAIEDQLVDWFYLAASNKRVSFSASEEESFIEKVKLLIESGLPVVTAKKRAFDFIVEQKNSD